jgi:hypothetical protein
MYDLPTPMSTKPRKKKKAAKTKRAHHTGFHRAVIQIRNAVMEPRQEKSQLKQQNWQT